MSYIDFGEFKRACLASPAELTEFLSMGEFMESYIFSDYWNLFNALLKDKESNVYGLFDGSILVGVGSTFPTTRTFGRQIIYWIRNGYHGKGLGLLFMDALINRTITENGFTFAELVIDRENIPSIKVAESLGLTLIDEWDNIGSGQGKLNSGKFAVYCAFDHELEVLAEESKCEPFEILQQMWWLEAIGEIEAPKTIIRYGTPGGNRIVQTLRFSSHVRER